MTLRAFNTLPEPDLRRELIEVEGIAEKLADRILAFRRSADRPRSLKEIEGVKGIGPTLVRLIRAEEVGE